MQTQLITFHDKEIQTESNPLFTLDIEELKNQIRDDILRQLNLNKFNNKIKYNTVKIKNIWRKIFYLKSKTLKMNYKENITFIKDNKN